MVNVTEPVLISAKLGAYVGCKTLALSKVPVPEVVQLTKT